MAVGQCKYALITNAEGGILNDPIILKLDKNKFWISLADSDVLFWAQGVAVNAGFDVQICEPDASPLQLQGPRSMDIMKSLFGEEIADLKYYWIRNMILDGMDLIISRTGWSSELGYEIYLQDGARGTDLWDRIMTAGEPFGLRPGHTSTIRRIEGGMLSYHADMDITTNPFELGLDRLIALDVPHDFVGKAALAEIKRVGPSRKQVGLILDTSPLASPNTKFWPVIKGGIIIGKVTSAVYSPRLEKNIAMAMIDRDYFELSSIVEVEMTHDTCSATMVEMPFYDPKKSIAKN